MRFIINFVNQNIVFLSYRNLIMFKIIYYKTIYSIKAIFQILFAKDRSRNYWFESKSMCAYKLGKSQPLSKVIQELRQKV
jgi:hypothetical protein